MRRYLISLASLVALPALLQAQGRGGMGMARSFSAAPHAAMRSAPAPSHAFSGTRSLSGGQFVRSHSGALVYHRPPVAGGSSFRSSGSRRQLSQDVPGLGFDYPHLAAVGGSRGRGRSRGRDFGRRSLFAYFPFYGGGYDFPLFDYDDSSAGDQYPDSVEPDYYPPGPPPPRPADSELAYGPPPQAPAAEPTPARPADEYVFVRRDGTLFFAVAYAWENGTLRYITGEGVRQSIAGTAIDLDATLQFNEQRGLNFRLPA